MQTTEEIVRLVETEIAAIADERKRKVLEEFLVTPQLQMREWEWSAPIEKFPCWIVADLRERDVAIAFFGVWSWVHRISLGLGLPISRELFRAILLLVSKS
jgi:hypothetical protein